MKFIVLLSLLFFANVPSETHTLTLTVHDIKNISGTLEIGLFNNGERFLEEGQAFRSISVDVTSTSETIEIKDLPPGSYAISMFQDLNGDEICNLNFMGIPKEPYAFSNNFRPKFSAPTFTDCQFEINSDKSIKIELVK